MVLASGAPNVSPASVVEVSVIVPSYGHRLWKTDIRPPYDRRSLPEGGQQHGNRTGMISGAALTRLRLPKGHRRHKPTGPYCLHVFTQHTIVDQAHLKVKAFSKESPGRSPGLFRWLTRLLSQSPGWAIT